MSTPDTVLSDKTLNAEERLASFTALARGLAMAMTHALRRVSAYNELLGEELDGRPGVSRYLSESNDTLERALALVESFGQTFSSGDDFEAFDIGVMLEGVVKRCRAILPTGRTLSLELGDEEIVVTGSIFRLQELLMRVLEDYLAARPLSCGIRVAVGFHQLDERLLGLLKSPCAPGRYAVVTVSADSEPFDASRQQAFWDVFASVDSALVPGALSLVHVYGTATGHGGDVFFQKTSSGMALDLVLPVQATRKDMQAPHNIGEDALYGGETILLVDDEDMIWDVIIDMLQELGYSVILAGNGREAVDIYRENRGEIDLVILDMVMPELDGHETFFQLKEIDPQVRVLLSSGYVSEDDAREALNAGAAGFLQKPYRMVDLARRIRAIFDTGAVHR